MCAHKHFAAAASRGNITKWLIKALVLLLFPVVDALCFARRCAQWHRFPQRRTPREDSVPLEPFAPQRTHIWWKQEAWCASPDAKGQYACAIVR